MRTLTRPLSRSHAVALHVTAAAVAVTAACTAQPPGQPGGPEARPAAQTVAVAPTVAQAYFEFQVTKPVKPRPGNPGARYPDALRAAKVEGQVLVQFVVDTAGLADTSTFKVLRSSHGFFTDAVRSTIPALQFEPAEIDGRKVRQLVQMPFEFRPEP